MVFVDGPLIQGVLLHMLLFILNIIFKYVSRLPWVVVKIQTLAFTFKKKYKKDIPAATR